MRDKQIRQRERETNDNSINHRLSEYEYTDFFLLTI